jgi:hypothetical protein
MDTSSIGKSCQCIVKVRRQEFAKSVVGYALPGLINLMRGSHELGSDSMLRRGGLWSTFQLTWTNEKYILYCFSFIYVGM